LKKADIQESRWFVDFYKNCPNSRKGGVSHGNIEGTLISQKFYAQYGSWNVKIYDLKGK